MEDLLVASAAVASETPEGKVGLGGRCTEDSECADGLKGRFTPVLVGDKSVSPALRGNTGVVSNQV